MKAACWIGIVAALAVSACGEVSGPPGEPTGLARVGGDGQRAEVGTTLPIPISVRVRDARGVGVEGVRVDFAVESGEGTLTSSSSLSDAAGVARTRWTLGTRTGPEQRVLAAAELPAGTASLVFRATAVAGPPAAVTIVQGNGQHRAAGARLRDTLVVRAGDRYGNAIVGASIEWRVVAGGGSVAPASSTTAADGTVRAVWTLGAETGIQRVDAVLSDLSAPFTALADPAPVIQSIEPDTVAPGAPITIAGAHFNSDPLDTRLLVNGSEARLLSVTADRIVAAAPCVPTGIARIALSTNGAQTERTHPVRNANPIRLAAGEATLLSGGTLWCNEIAGPAGRYVLAIANPATAEPAVSFRVRGAAGAAPGPAPGPPPRARAGLARSAERAGFQRMVGPTPLDGVRRWARLAAHASRLDHDRHTLRSLASRTPPAAPVGGQATALPAVNDTLLFRIPDLGAVNLCTVRTTVSARVVFVGTRAIVLEDVRAPLATRMDSLYRAMGAGFDSVYYPLLRQNFGDPLAYDAQTDADGHVYLLFTRAVNELGGVAGFVTAGNFFPATLCAASNRAEVFFGVVPTEEGGGFGSLGTRDNWFRTMRAVVMHESKHIVSYAERLAGNAASFEEPWLEEATSMVAEELYARAQFGYRQGDDVLYQASLFCEARPTNPACRGKPYVMYDHFTLLGDYLGAIESRTPLAPAAPTDVSFYGSSWALLRWVLDHAQRAEDELLRELTAETDLSGAANLQARSGFGLAEILADWIVAIALDGRSGFTPALAVHTLPSWNVRDIFAHMNIDFPALYPVPFPLAPRTVNFGDFVVTVSGLPAGTATVLELSGGAFDAQLIEISSDPAGSLASIGLRARLIRVE